ncbi:MULTISPECIES: hypothetical protein [unclassified Paenibacillus]|uniref:hypothetical protein n=1 Tax=unclassified Paenibacillus TaxID=185978 RepID=UPI00115FD418|nr:MULTISPECIES: hypothetical protein [unclassified Paenibacillus]
MNPIVRLYALWLLLALLIVSALPLSVKNNITRLPAQAVQWMMNSEHFAAAGPEGSERQKSSASAGDSTLSVPDHSVYPSVSVLEARHMLEQNVAVEGIVKHNLRPVSGERQLVQLQDETGDILVLGDFGAALRPGDLLRVQGVVGDTRGVLEVRARAEGIQRTGAADSNL